MFENMVMSKRTLGAVLATDGLMNSSVVGIFAASLGVDFCNKWKSTFNDFILIKNLQLLLSTGNGYMRPGN